MASPLEQFVDSTGYQSGATGIDTARLFHHIDE